MKVQMQKEKGFIKLNRKVTENSIWFAEPFDKAHAWIDLLLNCEHTDGQFCSKRGIIRYKRGECTCSLSELAKRWMWSRGKVRAFMLYLEENKMIKRRLEKYTYSIIKVLNYDKYQGEGKEKKGKKEYIENEEKVEHDKRLRFLLGDEYEEYIAEKEEKKNRRKIK